MASEEERKAETGAAAGGSMVQGKASAAAGAYDGHAEAGAGRLGFFQKLKLDGQAVMIQHTLFSLPFALSAILLETGGHPPLVKLLLIVAAAASGRNLANALNRIIDKDIDAKNPRTAGRHLPSGKLRTRDLVIFSIVMAAVLVASSAALGWICVALLPIAGIAIFGYSFTKRYTWLCHYWLGATCAIASMGSFIALTGHIFVLRYFVYSAAVALWVAGFDIIYAIQDIQIDRAQGLHSVPAHFGEKGARVIAVLSHLGTLALFAALPFFWKLGPAFWAGYGISALLLILEHIVSLGGGQKRIKFAAYNLNEIIPIVFLAAVAADIYLVQGR